MKQDKKKQKLQEGGAARPPLSPLPTTMRVRILRHMVTAFGPLRCGTVVTLPIATAQEWIKTGRAEEDKCLDGAPETK
jgi:hypothetical protein